MTTFSTLGLRPELVQALDTMGFSTPTDIQGQAIPHILNSTQDLVALAQTGTGKTGAFSLPIISKIDPVLNRTQALILCPTRELCLQISKDIRAFLSFLPSIKVAAIYGGDSYTTQLRALQVGPQIIVGTPGRTLDMVNRGKLNLEHISWLVLDEADEMLKMGFKEELDAILKTSPATKQTLLFSATMDRVVEQISKAYMKKPKEITTAAKNSGSANIAHEYYIVQARDKYEALKRILDIHPQIYGIIFCNTRLETQHIASKLSQEHYTAAAISGELSQSQREQVMAQFRSKQIRILVATDVAARGIDVKELSHVIHYGLPTKVEYYTHRSGRTGRANSTGTSIAIVHSRETSMIRFIGNKTGVKFTNKPIPTAKDICTAQLLHLIEKIQETKTDTVDLTPYLPIIEEKLAHLTREELIQHLVAAELSRFINFYKNIPDIHTPAMTIRGNARPESFSDQGMTRLRLNVGRKHGFSVPALFGMINAQPGLKGLVVGGIWLESDHTLFEVEARRAGQLVASINGKKVAGTILSLTAIAVGGGHNSAAPVRRSSPPPRPYNPRVSKGMFKKR